MEQLGQELLGTGFVTHTIPAGSIVDIFVGSDGHLVVYPHRHIANPARLTPASNPFDSDDCLIRQGNIVGPDTDAVDPGPVTVGTDWTEPFDLLGSKYAISEAMVRDVEFSIPTLSASTLDLLLGVSDHFVDPGWYGNDPASDDDPDLYTGVDELAHPFVD